MKMNKSLRDAIEHRRSCYTITDKSPVSDGEIEKALDFAIRNVPSAFNSQSARLVLLLHDHHKKLWQITKDILQQILPEEGFPATEMKINSFQAGYGTVLFYEDQSVVKGLQERFPPYGDNFPVWSNHSSAMHQYTVWVLLEDMGFGASLQHYNPLIDEDIQKQWNINPDWKLIAEMPFGLPTASPEEKDFLPVEDRVRVFK